MGHYVSETTQLHQLADAFEAQGKAIVQEKYLLPLAFNLYSANRRARHIAGALAEKFGIAKGPYNIRQLEDIIAVAQERKLDAARLETLLPHIEAVVYAADDGRGGAKTTVKRMRAYIVGRQLV